MNTKWLKPFFIISGLYDGILGLAFIFTAANIFAWYGVTPPNHMAYVQFPALLLLIFAAMFFRIASDPVRHRDLIPYGIALKVSYCSVAFWYYFTSVISNMWMPWAYADLVFLVLFIIAWIKTGNKK
jgi:hypothetical protein